ncbi:uncharacterized protein LOC143922494 [Arctopsyche grandis]|uniref:uncharacterized protein LOC143922494 n=1 Tax=Arctopsyche grandis TaxID=121162 RepID=UPI00406DA0FF
MMTEGNIEGWMVHLKLLVLVSGILGCIQGATWMSLTITGLVYYGDCSLTDNNKALATFADMLRVIYFKDESCEVTTVFDPTIINRRIDSYSLHIWFCIILAFSVLWLLSSGLMIASVRETLTKQSAYFITAWSSITLIVCIIDLALGILLGIDLGETIIFPKMENEHLYVHLIKFTTGVMMTIAFKGFFLWILNFAFSIVLLSASVQIMKPVEENPLDELPNNSAMARKPINAFESPQDTRPAPWIMNPRPQFNNQTAPYSMYSNNQGEINPAYMGVESPRYQQQQPLASIMKRSVADAREQVNNKPRSRNEPNLPSPDYSPPPQVRPRPPFKPQAMDNSQSYHNNPYRR